MKKKLHKNKKQPSLFKVVLYTSEFGMNSNCSFNTCNKITPC
jgi:hypothetical protein